MQGRIVRGCTRTVLRFSGAMTLRNSSSVVGSLSTETGRGIVLMLGQLANNLGLLKKRGGTKLYVVKGKEGLRAFSIKGEGKVGGVRVPPQAARSASDLYNTCTI